jgi:hypothetical protein
MDGDIDEAALNTLLADGVDAPTAFAASVSDEPQDAVRPSNNHSWLIGVIVGALLVVLWLLW